MRGFQHQMIRIVNPLLLLPRLAPPQQIHNRLLLLLQLIDHRIRKLLPAQLLMGQRFAILHRQDRVQKQYPILAQSSRFPSREKGTWYSFSSSLYIFRKEGGIRTP